jgi:hypothetical protein
MFETVTNTNSGSVITHGIVPVSHVSGFTTGDDIYLSSATGQLTATAPTSGVVVYIGKYNTGKLYLDIRHIATYV